MTKQGGKRSDEVNKGVLFPDSVAEIRYECSLVRSHLNHYAQDNVPMSRQELYKTLARLNRIMEMLDNGST